MRLLVVTNGLPPYATGGAEAAAYHMSEALAERHDVLVLSGTPANPDAPFVVHELPLLPRLPHDASSGRKILWHMRDQWRPKVGALVTREIRRHDPDVVITHNVQGLTAAVYTALARCRVRHVHMAHDFNLVCVRASMTKSLRPCSQREPECLVQRWVRGSAVRRRLDLLVAPSEFVRDRHVTLGIVPEDRAVVLRHGVRFPQPCVRRPTGPLLQLGFIGGLTKLKGVLTLLQAFQSAPQDWRLHIAGIGPLHCAVEQAADVDKRISYWGHVTGERKEKFYDGLDVLVVPSEWEENSALVVVEGSVRGIPTIVSDRGGLPEHPGVRVFRSGDPNALRQAIEWLAASPDRLRASSEELVAISEEYSWERYVRQLENLLRIACSGFPIPDADRGPWRA